MSESSVAVIIASRRGRSGKTLLARTLVDYFVLSGARPHIFDTDVVEQGLQRSFPEALVINLSLVADQMLLFDTLANPAPGPRIVEITAFWLTKFFQLMQDTDFVAESRSQGVEPVVFYIPDRKVDSFEAAVVLRDIFADCPFVVVQNGFFKTPANVQQSPACKALRKHKWQFTMPELTDRAVDAIEAGLSLSEFMRQPISSTGASLVPDDLTPESRMVLRRWTFKMFQEIRRVLGTLNTDVEPGSDIGRKDAIRSWDIGEQPITS